MKKCERTPKIKPQKAEEKKTSMQFSKQTSLKLPKIPLKKTNSIKTVLTKKKSLKITLKNDKLASYITPSLNAIPPPELIKINNYFEEKIKNSMNSDSKTFNFDLCSVQLHEPCNLQILIDFFSKMPQITILNLQIQKNFLDDSDILNLMQPFEKFIDLQSLSLNLEQNFIGNKGLIAIAKKLALYQNLHKLYFNLTWIGIKDLGFSKLGSSMNSLLFLIDLELIFDWNTISFDAMMDFFINLKNVSSLKFLKLSLIHTGFNDDLCMGLLQFLDKQRELLLLKLNLKWNEIGDEGFLAILPGIFKKDSKLKRLEMNFDNNRISDVGLLSLSHLMKNLKDLQVFELKLYDNLIDLSYQLFIEEILRKKSLMATIFHLGKCIFNDKQIIITKFQYNEVLRKFKRDLDYKEKRRTQLLNAILAITSSKLKKVFRKEILDEIIGRF